MVGDRDVEAEEGFGQVGDEGGEQGFCGREVVVPDPKA